MNILLQPNDIKLSNIYFSDKKTNIIIDGIFTKIVFSNNCMSMNGIYIDFPLKNIMTNKIQSKNIIQLDIINNKEVIQKIIDIEKQLLFYYYEYYLHDCTMTMKSQSLYTEMSTNNIEKYKGKNMIFNLRNQLQSGYIKYYKDYNESHFIQKKAESFYIKISGIWENQTEIGITFKLIEYQKKV